MRIKTPEEIAAENFGAMTVTDVAPLKPEPEFGPSPVAGVSDEEFIEKANQENVAAKRQIAEASDRIVVAQRRIAELK